MKTQCDFTQTKRLVISAVMLFAFACSFDNQAIAIQLPKSVQVESGVINRVAIRGSNELAIVYGPPSQSFLDHLDRDDRDEFGWRALLNKSPMVLLTTHRRDLSYAANAWRANSGAAPIFHAPASAESFFLQPMEFWKAYPSSRFDDMQQQTTLVRGSTLQVSEWVKDGTTIEFGDDRFKVIETPGYTRDGVSYVIELEGKKIAFVGDLIYGDGQILDLFSFQDAIHDARIRGYHGYASRCHELIQSLEKIKALNLDFIVPARGPIIEHPAEAIDRLIERVRKLYANYLSTSALHWYFKRDNMELCGRRILSEGAPIELMPYSEHVASPDWVWEFATSRLIISKTKRALLLDCWNEQVPDAVKKLQEAGTINSVDGIFVTHYHNDHTAFVQKAAEEFECPVIALDSYVEVLEHPSRFHLPALTAQAIKNIVAKKDGATWNWEEFEITAFDFPGQTIHHGALFVQPPEESPILFVGDSFAPSGLDDYCVWNRNLLGDDQGYLYCLKKLRELPDNTWLVNQHIPFVFRFSDNELTYLETKYRERIELQRELFPWDHPNYGVDPQWAAFIPRVIECQVGEDVSLNYRITNHSPVARDFQLTLHHGPSDLGSDRHFQASGSSTEKASSYLVKLQPAEVRRGQIEMVAPDQPGEHLVTADIDSNSMPFPRRMEVLLIVSE